MISNAPMFARQAILSLCEPRFSRRLSNLPELQLESDRAGIFNSDLTSEPVLLPLN